jgi:FixJ family two-component response regulator
MPTNGIGATVKWWEIDPFKLRLLTRQCLGLSMIDSTVLIAIIDDDPSVCRALERLVRSLGMRASTFPSGESFFHTVASVDKPDCVVVDVQMPGMNGLEVQERMDLEHLDIPLIFMAAHTDEAVAKRVVAMGAVGFLNKPFADNSLIELIQRALHRPGKNGIGSNGKVG